MRLKVCKGAAHALRTIAEQTKAEITRGAKPSAKNPGVVTMV
jgi:hypothetical protein